MDTSCENIVLIKLSIHWLIICIMIYIVFVILLSVISLAYVMENKFVVSLF